MYKWQQRNNEMAATELKRIKKLEEENAKLKLIYANLAMELDTVKWIIEKSFKAYEQRIHCLSRAFRTVKTH
ncbi:MAG: hypothetical protein H7068_00330 [Pedobacter sp.]|nr:hypothetical protein [Chitinophagaceae bacterium]